MKKKILILLFCLLALVVSSCGSALKNDYFSQAYHTQQSYEQLNDDFFDFAMYQEKVDYFYYILEQRDQEALLEQVYSWLCQEAEIARTQYSQAVAAYYQNMAAPDGTEQFIENTRNYYQVQISLYQVEQAALNSSHYGRDFARYTGLLAEDYTLEEKELEELVTLVQEELDLLTEYYQAVARGFSIQEDGETWTLLRLERNSDQLSEEEYMAREQALYQLQAEAVGDIYIQLLANRQQQAEVMGYAVYDDYAYDYLYQRDYNMKEADAIYLAIEEVMAPIYYSHQEQAQECLELIEAAAPEINEEAALTRLVEYAPVLAPEIGEAATALQQLKYLDITYTPGKGAVNRTLALPSYGQAFILMERMEDISDYSGLARQFGSYLAIYHDQWSGHDNYDLGAVYALTMELLYMNSYDSILGTLGQEAQFCTLHQMLGTVVNNSIYDQFQQEAAGLKNPTVESLSELYYDICKSYGKSYPRDIKLDYSWCLEQSLFDMPFYSMSYVSGGLSALDIWLRNSNDPIAHTNDYLTLLTLGQELGFRDTLEEIGQENVMNPSDARRICSDMEGIMQKLARKVDMQ